MFRTKKGVLVGIIIGVLGINSVNAKPINTSFIDDNFYKCVIDRYNKENDTSYDESYNLSDDELKQINYLTCSSNKSDKITDYSGIEKLTNLEKINLDVASDLLDLSGNILLKELELRNFNEGGNNGLTWNDVSYLKKLNISKNVNLVRLRIDSDSITDIDVSNNKMLKHLTIWSENLKSLDLRNNDLLSLNLGSNKLLTLDLSKQTNLRDFEFRNSIIRGIDLSKNVNLVSLSLKNGKLSSIDLSNNLNLVTLNLSDNDLETINLKNNVKLEKLYLYGNSFMKNITIDNKTEKSIDDYVSLPSKFSVSFEVDDNSIATVVDNKIKGLKVGNTNGVLKISNTYNLVQTTDDESGFVGTDGIKYKYVVDDVDFSSNVRVINKENILDDDVNDKQNNGDNDMENTDKKDTSIKDSVDNPKTGVYTGSIVIFLISIIGYILIKKSSILKKI